jgi:hypothetical protein
LFIAPVVEKPEEAAMLGRVLSAVKTWKLPQQLFLALNLENLSCSRRPGTISRCPILCLSW